MQTQFTFLKDPQIEYPWVSKSRLNRAGEAIKKNQQTTGDEEIIDRWRDAHRHVLNTFQSLLRTHTIGRPNVTVAQRHKRKRTIVDKLHRFSEMQLSRMDDIAGCRVIFQNIHDLDCFREEIHSLNVRHKLRNEADKYNYIRNPKSTGYRGIHDVYEYDPKSRSQRYLRGLYIEIQYRTLIQHAWATTVEVLGHVTESRPKFQQGDQRLEQVMAYASEILARGLESSNGPFPQMSHNDLITNFEALASDLKLFEMLKGLNAAGNDLVSKKPNAILILGERGDFQTQSFEYSTQAIKALFELERKFPLADIVLVRADQSESVRIAYKNYFSDASDFLTYLHSSIDILRHKSSL